MGWASSSHPSAVSDCGFIPIAQVSGYNDYAFATLTIFNQHWQISNAKIEHLSSPMSQYHV